MHRFNTKEAASMLGFSESTLRHWRQGSKVWKPGLGPHFFTINGRVFYTAAALSLWMRQFASDDVFEELNKAESLA